MQAERPVLKLTASKTDVLLDRLSLAGILFLWIFTLIQYAKLPAIIPTHFNAAGEIDDHGTKATLFLLPAIITVVVAGLTILNNYPHLFNYMQQITVANALQQYTAATRLIRILKLVTVAFIIVLMLDIVQSAKDGHSALSWWIIPIFMLSMIVPVIIFLSRSYSKKEQELLK